MRKTAYSALTVLLILFAGSATAQSYYGPTFTHESSDDNIALNWTVMDTTILNFNPEALIFVTPNRSANGVQTNFRHGVWYDGANWTVYNENPDADFTQGTGWNVVQPQQNGNTFLHTASASNTVDHFTVIDHPSTNQNPEARIVVTHQWITNSNEVFNDQNTGVRYLNDEQKWAIFNEDPEVGFPTNAAYNVFVPDTSDRVFVHTATAANTNDSLTQVQHPLLDNNPNAQFLITHNWNPNAEENGVFDNHPNAVFFDGAYWNITNESGDSIPGGAAYNVVVLSDASTTGVAQSAPELNWNLFPNPATDYFQVSTSGHSGIATVRIFDRTGRVIRVVSHDERWGLSRFPLKNLAPGTYFVELSNRNGRSSVKPLVVVR